MAKLNDKVSVNFDKLPLGEVVKYLQDYSGLKIVLDPGALREEGLTSSSPVSLATQAAVPLKSVLKQMLKPLGLTYKIEDEMVLITSPQAAVATGQAIRKTYYIGDLIKQGQFMRVPTGDGSTNLVAIGPKADVGPVISLIETTIAPGTWMVPDPGGGMVRTKVKSRRPVSADEMGSIIPFYLSVSLIIECTEDVHEDLANFFRGLRDLIYSRDGVDGASEWAEGPGIVPKGRQRRRARSEDSTASGR